MNKIYINGNIHTMNEKQPHVEALYLEDEYIKDSGSSDEIKDKHLTPGIEVIDLNNKTVIPGFNDSHLHLYQFALSNNKIALHKAKTFSDITKSILDHINKKQNIHKEKSESEQWVVGFGWHEKNFIEPLKLDRKLLDNITTNIINISKDNSIKANDNSNITNDNSSKTKDINTTQEYPIILKRVCFHLAVVNSRALEISGITKNTPDPPGGKIGRYPDGEPNGLLYDSAIDLVEKKIGEKTTNEIKTLLLSVFPEILSKGITSIQTDDFLNISKKSSMIESYLELSKKDLLPLRVNLQLRLESPEEIANYRNIGYKTGRGNEYLRFGPVKIIYDGSLGARTAALIDGYHDSPDNKGELLLTQEELNELVLTAHQQGFQLAVHTIGDASLKNILEAFRKMLNVKPVSDARPIVIHAQIANLELFREMKKLGVIACIQPSFLATDWPIIHDRVGPIRARTSYAWKTMWNNGIVLSGSSDAPIEPVNPLWGIHAAVNRKDRDNKPAEGWYPEEKLSVKQAVQLYTSNSAYQSFEENIKGTLEKGKLADFIVLSKDIFQINPEKIKDIEVEKTYLGGKLVYQK